MKLILMKSGNWVLLQVYTGSNIQRNWRIWKVVPRQKRQSQIDPQDSRYSLFPRDTRVDLKWVLIVFSIMVGLFLFSIDNTIVADIQPTIVEEFQSIDKIAWVTSALFLSNSALTLSSGQFYQVFNAKWLYVLSVFIFAAGSALCGAAPNINALIIGRVIVGAGATGIYTGSLFLLSVNTTEQERYTDNPPY
jgi:hypothetical protein